MLAVMDMIAPSEREDFRIWKQTRTDSLSHPLDLDMARITWRRAFICRWRSGRTSCTSWVTRRPITPRIADVIEASKIARRAVENALRGALDMTADPAITRRRKQLVRDAWLLLEAIALAESGAVDPLTDPGRWHGQ